ncbi:MAG: NAD-glutamate dehydrogenase domain-containing protein, partial [Glaciecola sp.]
YPREELLHSPTQELANIVSGIFQMQERGITRMFIRKDAFGRFISCMTYVPREKYNTALRKQTQAYLRQAFGSEQAVEFTTYFSESVYARTHYIVRVKDNNMDYPVKEIEQNIIELTKTWPDRFASVIKTAFGEGQSVPMIERYADSFSQSYMNEYLPSAALADLKNLERLSNDNPLEMLFYRPQEESSTSQAVRLKLYHRHAPIHLSDVLPMLENFGLRVIDETPYKIASSEGGCNWIMDFSMLHPSFPTDNMSSSQALFQEAFGLVWQNHLEDDAFNRLILSANITGRNVTILRAYAKYMRQIGLSFSIEYIANTMAEYPDISASLVELFAYRFNPDHLFNQQEQDELVTHITQSLDRVNNLDDDRIIRKYLDMIVATVRTNFYQAKLNGEQKSYVSFKLLPDLIGDMPLPLPKFEIFVYSPKVEGVHLRGGKVARGGLRWSDRFEDFRTEVLGLVKAQQVKNTVIVPVGAKGGFVCKQLPKTGGRDAFIAEGQACYRTFIRSLLDITDNIIDGEVVHPQHVVRHDDDDAYLVVAADKGTATFSDIANEIAHEFNFWLGDAFASGGSVGYDHKKMGITARGAWESVKRHFRELGVDCQTTEFTCIAVGDMAGDVFGNGMLLSQQTQLVAAFNHMHIFFDPTPDAAKSYIERERLFADPSLNWSDYDRSIISSGGGVFSRQDKSIALSKEMKRCLNTQVASMTPNELIHHILQMEVDLLWNGGIGTYVKSSLENHADVGDRANDAVRVNGAQIKAKIIGEGGNLGCTQLGRVEFAKHGGKVNTDFIDNVGGV